MKFYYVLIPFIISSCKTPVSLKKDETKTEDKIISAVEHCPEDGSCSFEIFEKSELLIKSDEIGSLYPEIIDGRLTVLKYEYKRNEIPDTADSGYSEIIYIQVDPDFLEINIDNKELSKVNLLYGRLCFCKGQTGYYRIDKGNLSIIKLGDNSYHLHLEFECEYVPQIINTLDRTFELK